MSNQTDTPKPRTIADLERELARVTAERDEARAERDKLKEATERLIKAVKLFQLTGVPELVTVDDLIQGMRNVAVKLDNVCIIADRDRLAAEKAALEVKVVYLRDVVRSITKESLAKDGKLDELKRTALECKTACEGLGRERDELRAQWSKLAELSVRDYVRTLITERDALAAQLKEARELLTRAVKWIDRLNERKDSIPHFFDNDTDPAPLAKDIRRYLTQCTHREVTVTEDGGRCNGCGLDMSYDATSRNWIRSEVPSSLSAEQWEENAKCILSLHPNVAIRVQEGGGAENLQASLAATMGAYQGRLTEALAQIERLREDERRLDWLEARLKEHTRLDIKLWGHDGRRFTTGDTLLVHWLGCRGGKDETLREAIDAALAQEPVAP